MILHATSLVGMAMLIGMLEALQIVWFFNNPDLVQSAWYAAPEDFHWFEFLTGRIVSLLINHIVPSRG